MLKQKLSMTDPNISPLLKVIIEGIIEAVESTKDKDAVRIYPR
jgi:hypothetical protein